MKLGVLLAGRRPEEITTRFEQARDAGFFLCQFNLCQSGFSRADIVAIADAAVDLGIRPAAVGCFVNPLSADEPLPMGATRADLDLILHSLDLLGARRVVIWSGTNAKALYEDHPENRSPDSLEQLREFLTDVVRQTRARHYFLCLELWHTHVLRDERMVVDFHESLAPQVQERVRYVLDAPALITETRYPDCDAEAARICETLGPVAGVAYLRDIVITPDGETELPAPCEGKLDFGVYVENIMSSVEPDVPAIVRNVGIEAFGDARDRLLRLSNRWELT